MDASLTRIVAVAALAWALPALPAAAADACANEAFTVSGTTVASTICAAAPAGGAVAITETYVAGSSHTTRTLAIPIASGEPSARGIDDVDLAPLGLTGSLHVTIRYREGRATIEHALLLPGAIPLK